MPVDPRPPLSGRSGRSGQGELVQASEAEHFDDSQRAEQVDLGPVERDREALRDSTNAIHHGIAVNVFKLGRLNKTPT